MLSAPRVRQYLSATKFLKDYFVFRQNTDPHFSYECWAAELNFKSRSYMRMICVGERRLTPEFIQVFAQQMQFSTEDINHLTLLALYDKAKTNSQRQLYLEKIIESLETKENRVEIKNYVEFLSSPILPLLQLILSFNDIDGKLEVLKNLLNEDSQKIKLKLATLENLGLIQTLQNKTQQDESLQNQSWKAKPNSFKVPDLPGNQALLDYHQAILKKSQLALQQNPQSRRFRTLLLALNSNEFEELSQEIENFLKKILFKFNPSELNGRKIYQFNLNSFAVTNTYQSTHIDNHNKPELPL